MGKIKGWCEKRKMGVKIRIRKGKKREPNLTEGGGRGYNEH